MQAIWGKSQAGDSAVQMGEPPWRRGGRAWGSEVDIRLIHGAAGIAVAVGGKGELLAVRRPGQILLQAGGSSSGGDPVGAGRIGRGCNLNLGTPVPIDDPGDLLTVRGKCGLMNAARSFQFGVDIGNARSDCFRRAGAALAW